MLVLRSCAARRGPRHGLLLRCRAPCSSGSGGGRGGGSGEAAEGGADMLTAGSLGSCGKSQLHRQILHFAEIVHPTEREQRFRSLAFTRTRDVVQSALPGAFVSQFGSTSTGIALPGSDLDIVVIHRPGKSLANPSSSLRKVSNAMQKAKLHEGKKSPLLIQAKVPILKFTERKSGAAVDLSCNSLDGLRNSQAIRVAVQSRSELQPLLLVLKAFLKQRGLNETFNGGIGSYLLFAMVLRQVEPRAASSEILHEAWMLGRTEQLRSFLGADGAVALLSTQSFHVADDVLGRPLFFRDLLRAAAERDAAGGAETDRVAASAAAEMDGVQEAGGEAVAAAGPQDGSKLSRPAKRAMRFPQEAAAARLALCSAGDVAMRFLLGEAVGDLDSLSSRAESGKTRRTLQRSQSHAIAQMRPTSAAGAHPTPPPSPSPRLLALPSTSSASLAGRRRSAQPPSARTPHPSS